MDQMSAGAHNLAGYLNKTGQAALELHPRDIASYSHARNHETVPCLQVPDQGAITMWAQFEARPSESIRSALTRIVNRSMTFS